MAIFANGPDYQTYSVTGTTPTQIFYTRGYGGTAIGSGVTVRNPTVVNAGTVALYVTGGTVAAVGATASTVYALGAGIALQPGDQLVIFGTAVTQSTANQGVFDLFGCVAGSINTITVEGGYATQTIVS
jgi:hypothetical protein